MKLMQSLQYSYDICSFYYSIQTLETEFGEPDNKGNARKFNRKDRNSSHPTKSKQHQDTSSSIPSDVNYTRQISNQVRDKINTAKEKISSNKPPIVGFASGLFLWIPGLLNGKQNQSSTANNDSYDNGYNTPTQKSSYSGNAI